MQALHASRLRSCLQGPAHAHGLAGPRPSLAAGCRAPARWPHKDGGGRALPRPAAARQPGSQAEYEAYIQSLAGLAPSAEDVAGLARINSLERTAPQAAPLSSSSSQEPELEKERVYLVGVSINSMNRSKYSYTIDESLEELERLADTAGLQVVGSTYQILDTPNMSTYIGAGKAQQVAEAVLALDVDTVIFDDELSPGQLRNLEKMFSSMERAVRVCDRTALILDIFQQRAATREGQLQVELASVEYQLPRLTRMWSHLDRVGGGGQVKGAGEKQIEIDKRLLRDRAAGLRRELESVRTHRALYRGRRAEAPIPVVAIVGYTNAGKSTLLNSLTGAGVLAEDKLFATLDPTTRKVRLRGNKELLMSDTVGFIQKLPTQLVAAFRATLEEIKDASVVLHVVDISHPNAAGQCAAVLQVLDELDVDGLPVITAWNKIDACANPDEVRAIAAQRRDTVCMSGLTGEGVEGLLEAIGSALERSMVEVDVLLPYSAGALVDAVHTAGRVKDAEYGEAGTRLRALVPRPLAQQLARYGHASTNGSVTGAATDDEAAPPRRVVEVLS